MTTVILMIDISESQVVVTLTVLYQIHKSLLTAPFKWIHPGD